MIQPSDEAYLDREQSAVKQFVLQQYLFPFAAIVGTWKDVAYIDCCAGPWRSRREDYSDTSFGIAINSLQQARDCLKKQGQSRNFSCLFIEQKAEPFRRLEAFCSQVSGMDVEPLRGDFSALIPQIKSFLSRHHDPFPFFFVDPTGWNAIRIDAIRPILKINPGEVLINFMTSHIRRFLARDGLKFEEILGDAQQQIAGLTGRDRDEAAVFAYANEVRRAGNYEFACTTVVPNPLKEQAHFHLIYATRNWRGVEKFKEAERRMFEFAGRVRHETKRRAREKKTGQTELGFGEPETCQENYLDQLRYRFLATAEGRIRDEVLSDRNPSYNSLLALYLRRPLVWQSDFRKLLGELRREGITTIQEPANAKTNPKPMPGQRQLNNPIAG